MDGSRRSSHGNAFFTGFGRAKRIVFFDTLLARLAPDEIEAVLAHELGHFKLHHVLKRMLWMAALSLAVSRAARLARRVAVVLRGPRRAARRRTAPGVALILFLLALPVFTFVLAPLVVALLAPARVRGRRLRRAACVGGGARRTRWSSCTRTTPRR